MAQRGQYHWPVAALLLVEDDPLLRTALVGDLAGRGHTVRSTPTALEALREFGSNPPDLVILDLNLPDLDGAAALKMLRALHQDIPVVVASGRDRDEEVVELLLAGADDYLVKPFSGDQLHARITAVLRRSRPPDPDPVLIVGDLRVDVGRREVTLAGRSIQLTRREFDLLAYLATRQDQVVTRRELLSEVWEQAYGHDQTIDVHVSWLRRKLGESASEPRYIHTVRGVGVRLAGPG